MPHPKLSAAAISLILQNCATTPPERPVLEGGILDIPREEVIVGTFGLPGVERKPIGTYDKAVCYRPSEWEKKVNYDNALRRYADNCYKTALELMK